MFDQATIKNIKRETADSVVVSIDLPEDIKQDYSYKQGQNITFIREFEGEELRRSYSICNSIDDAEIRVGIKRVDGGRFSTWANTEMKVGDRISVLPPSGEFHTELNVKQSLSYVGVAAGSGITPILSILKTILETEPLSHFSLIYGNKSTESIMFLEDIKNLKNKYKERFQIFNILSQETQNSELLNGRIDKDKINRFLERLIPSEYIDHVFLCGPYQMIVAAKDAFVEAGVSADHIHTELFGTPDELQLAVKKQQQLLTEEEASHLSQITLVIDGKGTKIKLARGGESILDAALKVRKDLPFACKGGVCATCKAKVTKGQVVMDINYSLSEEEEKSGYTLTCQSHPISDHVVIDFDQK